MKPVTTPVIDQKTLSHIAKLANLTIPQDQLAKATAGFSSVLDYVSNIQNVDTSAITERITTKAGVQAWREDVVDPTRTFRQEEALSNAPKQHDGYFMVDSILAE